MRLENMTPGLVRRAVEIYLGLAWPKEGFPRPRITTADLDGIETL
jgi:hypothetical protein